MFIPKSKRTIRKDVIRRFAIKTLTSRGCEVWAQNNVRAVKGRKFVGRKGVPDIIGFHRKSGLFVGCEVKAGTDRLSPDQTELMTALAIAGAIVVVAFENEIGNIEIRDFRDYIK